MGRREATQFGVGDAEGTTTLTGITPGKIILL